MKASKMVWTEDPKCTNGLLDQGQSVKKVMENLS